MSRWLAAAALLGCWGCAFSLDGPDPNRPRNRVPQCDTSKGLVALDGVMATTLGIFALAATDSSEPALALLPLGLGALYLGGAVSGNRAVNSCREAQDIYTRSYGDERMVLSDGDEGAEEDDEGQQSRGGLFPRPRKTTQGQQTYPPSPQQYPQQPYPQLPPQQQQPQPAQQPPPQGPPQPPPQEQPRPAPQQPVKAKPARVQEADDDDWTDFWREVP